MGGFCDSGRLVSDKCLVGLLQLHAARLLAGYEIDCWFVFVRLAVVPWQLVSLRKVLWTPALAVPLSGFPDRCEIENKAVGAWGL